MKRGIIKLNGASPMFRVSQPGVDVDAAAAHQLVAHEDFVFAQPFAFGYVACPFAGYTGTGVRDQSATVVVPDIGVMPTINVFAHSHMGTISYPYHVSEGGGSSAFGYEVIQNTITASYVPGLLTVQFIKNSSSIRSLNGCYYMLTRSADA